MYKFENNKQLKSKFDQNIKKTNLITKYLAEKDRIIGKKTNDKRYFDGILFMTKNVVGKMKTKI